MNEQLWVGSAGDLIIARLRGRPNETMLRDCQDQVLRLVRTTGQGKVLYDTLEMLAPPAALTFVQRTLDNELGELQLRRAIVVPDSRLAYLARIAFGEGDYRVFYNDITAAIQWLSEAEPLQRMHLA